MKKSSAKSISQVARQAVKYKNSAFSPKNMGIYGERVVNHYLKSKGHVILGRNLRLKCGEIDILSLKNKVMHITEVKTVCLSEHSKDEDTIFRAEDNLSKTKIRKLHRLRVELSYWLEAGQFGKFLSSKIPDGDGSANVPNIEALALRNLEIQIDGIAVDVYRDNASNAVSRIKVRYFPYL
jgi:Holliday junction resolvase-like predicted endonuclease